MRNRSLTAGLLTTTLAAISPIAATANNESTTSYQPKVTANPAGALAAHGLSLAEAAQQEDDAAVRALLAAKTDVNAPLPDGTTALHFAAANNDLALVQLLLRSGANPRVTTLDGDITPLSLAAGNGNAPIVEALLKAGADANAASANGTTALMLAASSGSVGTVNVLINHGADINAKESVHGQTALMFAAAKDRSEVIRTLITRGATANATSTVIPLSRQRYDDDGNPIGGAPGGGAGGAAGGRRRGRGAGGAADGAAGGVAPVAAAADPTAGFDDFGGFGDPSDSDAPAGGGQARRPRRAAGDAPAGQAATPAAGGGAAAAAGSGGDTDGAGGAPQRGAGGRGGYGGYGAAVAGGAAGGGAIDPDIAAQFGGFGGRGGGPQRTTGGNSALILAAREGHLDAIRALLQSGADVNEPNAGDKTTPIVTAICNGHYDVAKYLLDHGADPNLKSVDGLGALYATIDTEWAPVGWAPNPITDQEQTTYLDLMKALIDHGADVNATLTRKLWFRPTHHDEGWANPSGANAFWRAAQATDIAAMKLLVAHGAETKVQTAEGVNALMVASGIGYNGNYSTQGPDSPLDTVKYCLELGIDPTPQSKQGYTSLDGAAYRGQNDLVKLLVSKGVKLDVRTARGWSVTDMANGPSLRSSVPMKHPETVALLLKLGAPALLPFDNEEILGIIRQRPQRGARPGGPGGPAGTPGATAATTPGATTTAAAPAAIPAVGPGSAAPSNVSAAAPGAPASTLTQSPAASAAP
jgi:ankyrin repeat protein